MLLPGLGELAPRLVVERVGDRHARVGLFAGVHRLAIGMIAPDKVAPAGGELSERQRRAKAELRRDLSRSVAGTRRRFAWRRLGRRRSRGRSAGSSVQSKARPNRALPPEPSAGPKATPRMRGAPGRPAPSSYRRAILPACLVEGALKGVAAAVGHCVARSRRADQLATRACREASVG